MRDYDKENRERHEAREREITDRQFKLGGEVFRFVVNVPNDVLLTISSPSPLSGGDYIRAIRQSCLGFIEDTDGAHERFLEVVSRSSGDDIVTMEDLQAIFSGLVSDAFNRPTQASLPSGDGDAESGTGSTETLSTEPAVASAA